MNSSRLGDGNHDDLRPAMVAITIKAFKTWKLKREAAVCLGITTELNVSKVTLNIIIKVESRDQWSTSIAGINAIKLRFTTWYTQAQLKNRLLSLLW